MELEDAVRTRRTHKAYGPEPVEPQVLRELVALACWAPNHHLTQPWRFRVVGPRALAALQAAGPADAASKLLRAPTLVVASVVRDPDPRVALEDRDATAAAVATLLLAAHDRGLAGYWRTPAVLLERAGRAAAGVPDGEDVVGLVHLGPARQDVRTPDRLPVDDVLTFLP